MTTNIDIVRAPSELSEVPGGREQQVSPAVDVFENSEEYLVVADMPGVEPDDLKVNLEGSELSIEGRQSFASEIQGNTRPLVFLRSISVSNVDVDQVNAELKQGVLRIKLRKTQESRARKIAVKAV